MRKLFFVRHGQSAGNANKEVYFTHKDQDIPLTTLGTQQAFNAAQSIVDLTKPVVEFFTLKYEIYVSPYLRAVETAQHLRDGIDEVQSAITIESEIIREDPRLREREWGVLRDLNDTLPKGEKDDLFTFFYKPTGGESFANVYDRVANFHQWLITNTSSENIIIVAHGESIKCYLAYLLGWNPEEFSKWSNPKNCEVILVNNFQNRYWIDYRTPLRQSKYYKSSKIIH